MVHNHGVSHFQRRLIARNEELVDRDMSLREKEKVVAELRMNLARLPGQDIVDEARLVCFLAEHCR